MSIRDFSLFSFAQQCGCGAKLPPSDLRALLAPLAGHASDVPHLLIGTDDLDDAAVYEISDGLAIIQTVDFFPPNVADPRDFGRIASANALSDVYAMGGTPILALALLCVPSKNFPIDQAGRILAGARDTLDAAHAALVGGHTIKDPTLKFGLSVMGQARTDEILSNAAAQVGDLLVLTKPLGSGIATLAVKAQMADEKQASAVCRWMSRLNDVAAEAARSARCRAATDVTGFGLLGHAWQMAKASGVSMRLAVDDIPVLDSVADWASMGLVPSAAYSNRTYLAGKVRFDAEIPLSRKDVLFDPQTSGGLLVCVKPDRLSEFQRVMASQEPNCCEVIGDVVAMETEPEIMIVSSC